MLHLDILGVECIRPPTYTRQLVFNMPLSILSTYKRFHDLVSFLHESQEKIGKSL
jgi:hypothetical protein